jgi:predicted NUDIX family phosphoesterase
MNKDDEQILVLKSDILFSAQGGPASGWKGGVWQGLKTDNLDYYVDLIKKNGEFKRRGDVENDNSFQQIIPYIIFNYQDEYFLYRYLKQAGEQRLKNDYIIGIGGHINKDDIKEGEDVLDAGRDREWNEEVDYKGKLEKKLIGILNDDRRPVEAVHLGLVYLFKGESPDISVKETDKMKGEMFSLKELGEKVVGTEGWAPIIYDEYLSKLDNV